jgi:hypothetical protein
VERWGKLQVTLQQKWPKAHKNNQSLSIKENNEWLIRQMLDIIDET